MPKTDLTIIIPAYNEEKKIEKDVVEAFEFFNRQKISGEVIVSTDGVTDRTNDMVRSLQKKYKNLILISFKKRIGKGSAIKKAVTRAKGKFIMFADAGYCVPFKYINIGLNILRRGSDIALADRTDSKSRIRSKRSFHRQLGSKIFRSIIKDLLGIPKNINDTQCGFKLYKKNAAKKIFTELKTAGMMFDIEAILRAKKLGFKMVHFFVEWTPDKDSKFNPLYGSFRNLLELINIKFKLKL